MPGAGARVGPLRPLSRPRASSPGTAIAGSPGHRALITSGGPSTTATSSTQITYSGTATITSGTGTLSHAAGTVKLRCTSNDVGIHALCHAKVALP